jgi:hypothetical protein
MGSRVCLTLAKEIAGIVLFSALFLRRFRVVERNILLQAINMSYD